MDGLRIRTTKSLFHVDSPFSAFIAACAVTILCYLAARLAALFVLRPEMIWPIWPGCALLVAILLLAPRKAWPLLLPAGLVGFLLYDLPAGLTVRSSGLLVLGDTFEVLIAALGVTYSFTGGFRLDSVKSLARYLFFAVLLAPVSVASIGAWGLGGDYWVTWKISFLTEALALLTLTPTILGWVGAAATARRKPFAYWLEAAALTAGLFILGYITFVSSHGRRPELLYSLVPLLLWSALRFGTTGTSTSITVVAFLSIWGTLHGRGPFTEQGPIPDIFSLQLFLLFAATSFMFLAALAEEDNQAEQALRESDSRFRLVANTAPVMIWMSGPDKLCTYFNQPWLEFKGRTFELEQGNGWIEGVHPEDVQRCLETYTQSFDRREQFTMEYRLRRHDGAYRWILDIGVPRFHADGSLAGYIGSCLDVTDGKLAHQELAQTSERLRLAMEAGGIGGWEADLDTGQIIWFGKAFEQMGVSPRQFSGSAPEFWDRVHPEDRERLQTATETANQSKSDFDQEFRVLGPDGTERWLRSRGRFIYREAGGPVRMVGISVDITERRRVEEALRQSEERMRFAVQAGRMFAYEWDLTTDVIVRSEECASILGLTGEVTRTTGHAVMNITHPEDLPRVTAAIEALTPQTPIYRASMRVFRPDGGIVWLERTGRGFFDPQGRLHKLIGMAVDITDRKRAEEVLRQREADLREAQRIAQVGSWHWNPEIDKVTWSEELYRIYDRDPGLPALTYREHEHVFTPESWDRLQMAVRQALETGAPYDLELEVALPNGTKRWVRGRGEALRDSGGKIISLRGTAQDITERKHAEETLRESEEKFRSVFRSAGLGMVIVSVEGRFLATNSTFCEYLGYTEEELLQKPIRSVTHPDDWPSFSQKLKDALTSGERFQRVPKRCLHKQGHIVFTESSASLIRGPHGEPKFFVGEALDVTDRKRAEEALSSVNRRLIEAQERERTRIARELHDDINQRLVLLVVEIEQVRLSLSEPTVEVAARMSQLTKRISEISADLQAISHELHSSKLEYLGMRAAMTGFCREFAEQQGLTIELDSDEIPQDVPQDISLCLFRVLQEALHNAAKHSGVRHFRVQIRLRPRELHLIVSDAGVGFEVETIPDQRGLGLISMRERVRLLNGTITIQSQPMVGTTIHASIPYETESYEQRVAG
jgi:PAS domain S-box-containing protein